MQSGDESGDTKLTIPSRVGEIDGSLQFLALLGAGGCATVYKARHLQLDKEVAVKILQLDGKGETSVRRFLLEARVLCQVDHKNVLNESSLF